MFQIKEVIFYYIIKVAKHKCTVRLLWIEIN
jgi:hypothetical protein